MTRDRGKTRKCERSLVLAFVPTYDEDMIGRIDPLLVLVVDDDLDHCMMLELALQLRGYRVMTATSRKEALRELAESPVDVLVCDLTLGDGTALDVIHDTIRKPDVSIVLSGFDSDEDRQRSLAAGFDAHLVKPTPIDTLLDTIAAVMRRSDAEAPRSSAE